MVLLSFAKIKIFINKNDPFANTEKHAKVMRLKPNEPIEQIVENKQYNKNYKYE